MLTNLRVSRLVLAVLVLTSGGPYEPQLRAQPGKKAGEERADNRLKLKFCWCPPGEFTMGSPQSEKGRYKNEDQVEVTLTQGFWLAKTEVTQGQWTKVMGTEPWKGKGNVKAGLDYAASYVTWDDATEFCRKLTAQERTAGRQPSGWSYRLPTDAQWEYACRRDQPFVVGS